MFNPDQIPQAPVTPSPERQVLPGQFSDYKELARFLGIPEGKIAVAQIFDTSAYQGPNLLERDLDKYLSQLAIWSGADIVITRDGLLPGHLEYAQSLGFDSRFVVVDTDSDPIRNEKLQGFLKSTNATLITPFYETDYPKNALNFHNPEADVHQISSLANSKSHLHTVGREAGVPLFEGGAGQTMAEVEEVAKKLNYPIWLKIDGSGSDFVVKIDDQSELKGVVYKLVGGLLEGWKGWIEELKCKIP